MLPRNTTYLTGFLKSLSVSAVNNIYLEKKEHSQFYHVQPALVFICDSQ